MRDQEQVEERVRDIGSLIGGALPSGVGFCLMVFSFTDPWTTYVSSADRTGTIAAIRELADKLEKEGQGPDGEAEDPEPLPTCPSCGREDVERRDLAGGYWCPRCGAGWGD